MSHAQVFDALAERYDADFTESELGRRYRRAVWRRLDALFGPGDRILELGCGTGEDAVHLAQRGVHVLATDVAPAMVDAARRKAARAGLGALVRAERLDAAALEGDVPPAWLRTSGPFDGVVSDFGGLNCVADFEAVARGVAALLRPGARAAVCLMGPYVPWEWAWFLLHGRPGTAFRRLRRGGAPWRGLTVRYPSVRRARAAFGSAFRVIRVAAVGALLPPTYAEPWAKRHPRVVAWLDRWERRLETAPVLPQLADHYLMELERR